MDGFEIRPAGDGDRGRIIRLVSKMWGADITPRYEWLYRSNPHGLALTWLAIERETGDTVGCTSIFPRRVIVDGRERLGSIGGDCYVEPRVRRRGLATLLHRESLAGMRDHGVEFMYGPPNPNNLSALVKAGSHLVTPFKRWVRPLTGRAVYRAAFARYPSRIEASIAGLPIIVLDRLTRAELRGATLERVRSFGPEFDAVFDRAAPATSRVLCVRDSRYLRWRYLHSPSQSQIPFAVRQDGDLVGLVALEVAGEQAVVVDLFAAGSKMIDLTLQLILNEATAAACSSLEVSCTMGGVVATRLRRQGFIGRSERGFQVAASGDDPQLATLLNSEAWHFLAADNDMDTFFSGPPE